MLAHPQGSIDNFLLSAFLVPYTCLCHKHFSTDNKPLRIRDPSFSGSQLGIILLPRRNLAMSGHISDGHD